MVAQTWIRCAQVQGDAFVSSFFEKPTSEASLLIEEGDMLKAARILAILSCAALAANAQRSPDLLENPRPPDATPRTSSASGTVSGYAFPDPSHQFRNFLYSTFGPPGLISTAIGAGIDQGKPAPPEWDSGAQGYGERYGSRFAMNLTAKTTEYTLGALIHEDVAYHRCTCSGFLPRTGHAFISVLTAKAPGGRTVFSVPSLVAPYAGSFTAVYAWYPNRYEPSDALRIGNISFAFKAGGNLIGEFIAPRR
jgi:hypothetical protein